MRAVISFQSECNKVVSFDNEHSRHYISSVIYCCLRVNVITLFSNCLTLKKIVVEGDFYMLFLSVQSMTCLKGNNMPCSFNDMLVEKKIIERIANMSLRLISSKTINKVHIHNTYQ